MKNYVITFVISALLISTIGTAILMLMMPQTTVDTSEKLKEYENINKEEFKYENTKNITSEKDEKKYTVTGDSLKEFKRKYMYKPGNVNPFSTEIDIYNESINNNNDNSNSNTDNSNDGNGNSSHTGK